MDAISSMASFLTAHAGTGVLQVARDVYEDYRRAANEGNGIILFKNMDTRKGVTVYAYNAGALIKLNTQFTSFIAPSSVGKVALPNPLPLISSEDFGLYIDK